MIDKNFELYTRSWIWAGSWKKCIFSKDGLTFWNCVSKNFKEFYEFFKLQGNFDAQRGYCIMSPLATKLLKVVSLHEDITQLDEKKQALGIHVI